MEGGDLMTKAEVLRGFQVSPQSTHAPETSGAACKGTEELSCVLASLLSFSSDRSWRLSSEKGKWNNLENLQAGWPHFWSLGKSWVEQELLGMYKNTREKTGTGNSQQGLTKAK